MSPSSGMPLLINASNSSGLLCVSNTWAHFTLPFYGFMMTMWRPLRSLEEFFLSWAQLIVASLMVILAKLPASYPPEDAWMIKVDYDVSCLS